MQRKKSPHRTVAVVPEGTGLATDRGPLPPRGILGGILLVAVFLRFYRLDFDLPEVQYVDGFKFAGEAARMVTGGDLRPALFQYPGLFVNFLVVAYRALGVASEYGHQLVAANVSAFFGLATVVLTIHAARAISGSLGVLIATGLVAVSPVLVTTARTPAPDSLCQFFLTLAMVTVAKAPRTLRSWALVGAAVGLASSAKWTGIFAAPIAALAMVFLAWKDGDPGSLFRRAPVALAAALATFLITTPFFLSNANSYLGALEFESHIQRAGQIGRVQLNAADYLVSSTPTWEAPWLGTSLHSDLGTPAVILGAAGVVVALSGRFGFAGALYASSTLAFLLLISGGGWIKAIRFLLPIYPLVSILAGTFAEWALPDRLRASAAVRWALLLIVLGWPLAVSVRFGMALSTPSTNAVARSWLRENLPAGSVVFLGPFFTEDLAPLPFSFLRLEHVGSVQYNLPESLGPSPERDLVYTSELIDELKARGTDYLVLNSYFDGAFSGVAENRRYFPRSVASYDAFRERLQREATIVYSVAGWTDRRIGPDIVVWRLAK